MNNRNLTSLFMLRFLVAVSTDNWLKDYLAGATIRPLIEDIKMCRVRPSTVMLLIQKLTDEERKEMDPALVAVYEALQSVMDTESKNPQCR